MREALKGVPERSRRMPDGVIQMMISPTSGGPASADGGGMFEYFRTDRLPRGEIIGEWPGAGTDSSDPNAPTDAADAPTAPSNDQIF
jgi:hypothetical protein